MLLVAVITAFALGEGPERFPGDAWEVAESPQAVGWSTEGLELARRFSETTDTANVMIVHDGRVVHEWGDSDRVYMCHSMRKSVLSALYGIRVAEGTIDLDATLEELGIDDNEPSLTADEKKATVRQLLQARSGVYHPALYESESAKANRPARQSHAPGTFWYYNNWDFNALGTIYHNVTGRSVYEDLEDLLATPLGMQDFDRAKHTEFVVGADSVHPAYTMELTARDLARFGLMMCRGGRWGDRQIVPEAWVTESTTSYSDTFGNEGYGCMWWIVTAATEKRTMPLPAGSYSAQGSGGHAVVVIPQWDVVIVHRSNTYAGHDVRGFEFAKLLEFIIAARPAEMGPEHPRDIELPPSMRAIEVSDESLGALKGRYTDVNGDELVIQFRLGVLRAEIAGSRPSRLTSFAPNRFAIQRAPFEYYLEFEEREDGMTVRYVRPGQEDVVYTRTDR